MSVAKKVLLGWVLFALLDFLYLGLIRADFINSYFQNVNNDPPSNNVPGDAYRPPFFIPTALLVWFLLSLSVNAFVLPCSANRFQAAVRGALMGAIVFGVYDLTNMATLRKWTWSFTAQDVAWGALATGSISAMTF